MVPLLDMINHSKPSSAQYGYSEEKIDSSTENTAQGTRTEPQKGIILAANQPLGRGEQITVSYGRKGNNRYFVNYGFTLNHNPDDEGVMVFSMQRTEPFYQEKCVILQKKQIKKNSMGWINREFQTTANPRDINFKRFPTPLMKSP